jgi:uncharacterized protein (UPF0332 family)
LIVTARKLAKASPMRPRQADLKRSVSTAYYALFHALAKDAADLLVGGGPARADRAWVQVYRALEHGFAKNACKEARNLGFPVQIIDCANEFIDLQEVRHAADYDPEARFSRAEALDWVARAEAAIAKLRMTVRRDRKAFAVQVLFKKRS